MGAQRLDRLEQNLRAVNPDLDADDLSQLDSVSTLTPESPGWMHYATGLLELSSAFLQAQSMTNTAGIALGGAVMAAAALTLLIQQEWLHALFPMQVLLALITSPITHQP